MESLELVGTDDSLRAEFARDVAAGLTAEPKRLSCCWFYDREGSLLFEEICELPEYYLTRTERALLHAHADEIASLCGSPVDLVELGSGSAAKTRLLIEALIRRQGRLRFVPIDISPSILEESSRALLRTYPALEITAVAAEYHDGLRRLDQEREHPRLILWLGSNVGNFDRPEAARFIREVRGRMTPEDRFLAGIDLRKDPATLERAYDDARGVTARFNLNILKRINRELGGTFDPAAFRHRARYNEAMGRVEMHLESLREQEARIEAAGVTVRLAAGETIHTENSYKYSAEEIRALADAAGLRIVKRWEDERQLFSVQLLQV